MIQGLLEAFNVTVKYWEEKKTTKLFDEQFEKQHQSYQRVDRHDVGMHIV